MLKPAQLLVINHSLSLWFSGDVTHGGTTVEADEDGPKKWRQSFHLHVVSKKHHFIRHQLNLVHGPGVCMPPEHMWIVDEEERDPFAEDYLAWTLHSASRATHPSMKRINKHVTHSMVKMENIFKVHENDRVWQRKCLCGGGDEERGLDEEEGDGKEKGKEKSGKRATRSRAAAAAAKKKKTG